MGDSSLGLDGNTLKLVLAICCLVFPVVILIVSVTPYVNFDWLAMLFGGAVFCYGIAAAVFYEPVKKK